MDRDVWRIVSASVRRHARAVGEPAYRRRRPVYPTRLIVLMYLWGAYFDRPLRWACDRAHYHGPLRPRRLPSVSRFARRVKSDACREVLRRVHLDLRRSGVASDVGYFDGKPLTVGPASKDPDAARGHVSGGWAKGYKLHAYVDERRRILVWAVAPLNAAEQSVAADLLVPALPPAAAGAVELADGNYDAAPLHRALNARGRALLTPLKGQGRVGPGGRRPAALRRMGPGRREAVGVWRDAPGLARATLKRRNNVEGVFSVLAGPCGLGALPAHVRRLDRVRRHVGAKIILYHARLLAQERAAAA